MRHDDVSWWRGIENGEGREKRKGTRIEDEQGNGKNVDA